MKVPPRFPSSADADIGVELRKLVRRLALLIRLADERANSLEFVAADKLVATFATKSVE